MKLRLFGSVFPRLHFDKLFSHGHFFFCSYAELT